MPQEDETELHEEIDLNAEEEAALEATWKRLQAEEAIKGDPTPLPPQGPPEGT